MKKTKFVAILLIASLLLCAVCGCASTQKTAVTAAEESTAAQAATGASETVATQESAGTLSLATSADFPPYEFYDGKDIVGIDIEIAQAVASYLGMELSVEDMDFNAVVPAVQNGKYDIGMAGLTVNEERELVVDFTDSYATGIQAIIVPEGSPITCCDDLFDNIGSYKIGVQLATTGDIYACDDFGVENVEEYTKGADAILALTSGKIDAVIIDNEPAKAFIAANEGLVLLDTEYAIEDYAIIVSEGNSELSEQINAALAALKADGTIDSILAKYINAD